MAIAIGPFCCYDADDDDNDDVVHLMHIFGMCGHGGMKSKMPFGRCWGWVGDQIKHIKYPVIVVGH